MEGDIREVLAVIIAADSPAGRVAEAINDLTAHLPPPAEPGACPMCSNRFWPCAGFDDAAHRLLAARLRIGDLVPPDLHPRPGRPLQPPRHPRRQFGRQTPGSTRSITMDEVLQSTLCEAVYDRLDYLDTIVGQADETSRASLADTEITRLTGAWRELLEAHKPDARGRCRQCSRRRFGPRSPCSVWRTAHRHLIADAVERYTLDSSRTGRHSFGQTRAATPATS
ncbi:MAG: hypothetical protein ACRDQ5_07455 [Sciscionella sp.]